MGTAPGLNPKGFGEDPSVGTQKKAPGTQKKAPGTSPPLAPLTEASEGGVEALQVALQSLLHLPHALGGRQHQSQAPVEALQRPRHLLEGARRAAPLGQQRGQVALCAPRMG